MKCIRCGQENNEALKYCTQCGYPLGQGGGDVSPKKKSKKGLIIILLLIIVLGALAAGYFFIFKDGRNKTNVERVNTALSTLQIKGDESGTLKIKLELAGGMVNLDMNATLMYAKQNDKYYVYFNLDKSMFTSGGEMYAVLDNKALNIYMQSTLLALFDTSSSKKEWLKSSVDFNELGINYNDIGKKDNQIDLGKVLNNNNLKYIGKENGLSHYQIIIDKDLINALDKEKKYSSEEIQYLINMGLAMDIYIDSNDNLIKIEIDFQKILKGEIDNLDKCKITFEFSDLNKTVVKVPNEALNTTKTIEQFLDNDSNYNLFF